MKKDTDLLWLCRPLPSEARKDHYDNLDWAPMYTDCKVAD